MDREDTDSSSESDKEEVAVVPKQKPKFNAKANITDQTEIISIDPQLFTKLKLHKVQVRQLKKLQEEQSNGPKPVDPVKEAKKALATEKRLAIKAEKEKEKAEKERLAKLLEEEAKKKAELKSKFITFKVPIYKYIKKDKVAAAVKESIEADEGDNDETSEEEKPKRKPRQRRFQKDKVELDTSDEERVSKLESIDKALNQFAFAPRRRRFF
jgi:hypothetical protein